MDVVCLEERIGALERKINRTRRLAMSGWLLVIGSLAIAASSQAGGSSDVVRARKIVAESIVLQGDDGESMLTLNALPGGGSLKLCERGRNGHTSEALSLGVGSLFGGGALEIRGADLDGHSRAALSLGVVPTSGGSLAVSDWHTGGNGSTGTRVDGDILETKIALLPLVRANTVELRAPNREGGNSRKGPLVSLDAIGSCGSVKIMNDDGTLLAFLRGGMGEGGELQLISAEPLVPPNKAGRPLVMAGSDGSGNGVVRAFSKESWDRARAVGK